MGIATRTFAGLAAATVIGGVSLPIAEAGVRSVITPDPDTCRYAVVPDGQVPLRSGPGKRFETTGELQPSQDPLAGSCAISGKGGMQNWVRILREEHQNA
ncbi:hypothetical protein [Nonomuraea sp. LPB2021202275-12-8]|uniref:hypothetical protein n=1 Tax=Nonomuraea sp. LPB2021202275-12-8 TaxID=3120159 RepID=UPI00300D7FF4